MTGPDLAAVFDAYLDRLRRWATLAALTLYGRVDPADPVPSLATIGPPAAVVYAVAVSSALTATDEYMGLLASTAGAQYAADWRRGRPTAPLTLPSGQPFAQWMTYAPEGVRALIGQGMEPAAAIEVSQARTVQALATAPTEQARTTTFQRFLADAVISHSDTDPAVMRPWTDEVEQYANLWDGKRRREYQGPYRRWQRVPSPGACDFCLMLATRTDYTSADAAMYAGGGEGQVRMIARGGGRVDRIGRAGVQRRRTSKMEAGDRYHKSCRCTVRMTVVGGEAAISEEDYARLSTREADGNLPTFGTKNWRINIDNPAFQWDTEAVGIPMPDRAPWAKAWGRAPAAPKPRDRRLRVPQPA